MHYPFFMRWTLLLSALCACGGAVTPESAGDAGEVSDSAVPDTALTDSALPDTGSLDTAVVPGPVPPPRPTTTATGGKTVWFAINALELGVTPSIAWRDIGWDLDGRTTTKELSATSTNTCRRVTGAPVSILADGHEGRDNNFGAQVASVLRALEPDLEKNLRAEYAAGGPTVLLLLSNVAGDDNASVPGELYVSSKRGGCSGVPGIYAIDARSVDDTKRARVKFPKGYMAGGLWVSGDLGADRFDLQLPWRGRLFTIPLESGVITLRPSDRAPGTIAGASRVDLLEKAMLSPLLAMGLCPGGAPYDQVVQTVRASADLVSGAPSLQDLTRTCDAMSVGIDFVAEPVTVEDCRTGTPDVPSPCGG